MEYCAVKEVSKNRRWVFVWRRRRLSSFLPLQSNDKFMHEREDFLSHCTYSTYLTASSDPDWCVRKNDFRRGKMLKSFVFCKLWGMSLQVTTSGNWIRRPHLVAPEGIICINISTSQSKCKPILKAFASFIWSDFDCALLALESVGIKSHTHMYRVGLFPIERTP